MKRALSTALAMAAVLNLLVGLPAASGPALSLSVSPNVVRAGHDVQLSVTGADGAARYEWAAAGQRLKSDTPAVTTRFPQPGPAPVSVQALDASGQKLGEAQATVDVNPA